MSRRQGIFWICTLPASDVSDLFCLRTGELSSPVVWLKGQKEAGSVGGYLHYQFCVGFCKKMSLAAVKGIFGRSIHAELSRSEHAADYCCKEETRVEGPWEWGAKPIRRNLKTDWDTVWTAAVSGNLDGIPSQVRVCHYSALVRIGSDYMAPKAVVRTVWVFWGRSGTGKSRRAWDEAGLEAYCKDPRTKFFDGYAGQKNVVIDEFRGMINLILGGIDVAHILRWCDRYPVRVEVKGSSKPFEAETIWFTSNVDPRNWYPDLDADTLAALLRRFNIVHFN